MKTLYESILNVDNIESNVDKYADIAPMVQELGEFYGDISKEIPIHGDEVEKPRTWPKIQKWIDKFERISLKLTLKEPKKVLKDMWLSGKLCRTNFYSAPGTEFLSIEWINPDNKVRYTFGLNFQYRGGDIAHIWWKYPKFPYATYDKIPRGGIFPIEMLDMVFSEIPGCEYTVDKLRQLRAIA